MGSLIRIDGNQDYASLAKQDPRFEVCKLKYGDVAWEKDGVRVLVEEKRAGDLTSSLSSRRLQRQLRGMLDHADVVALALRTHLGGYLFNESPLFIVAEVSARVDPFLELSKWGVYGRLILLPPAPAGALSLLLKVREAWNGAHKSIVAGTDKRRAEGSSPFQRRMKRLLDGVGDVAAGKLEVFFEGDFMRALQGSSEEWKMAGVHKGIVRQLREMQSG